MCISVRMAMFYNGLRLLLAQFLMSESVRLRFCLYFVLKCPFSLEIHYTLEFLSARLHMHTVYILFVYSGVRADRFNIFVQKKTKRFY